MNIIIGDSNLCMGEIGNITGEIYIEINGQYFPEKAWNDFPVILLDWWIHKFLMAIKSSQDEFEFTFMDGPYAIFFRKTEDQRYSIFPREQGQRFEEFLSMEEVTLKELQNMLLKGCRKLFRMLEAQGIPRSKSEGLRNLFDELKKV